MSAESIQQIIIDITARMSCMETKIDILCFFNGLVVVAALSEIGRRLVRVIWPNGKAKG